MNATLPLVQPPPNLKNPSEQFSDVAQAECVVRMRYGLKAYRAVDLSQRYPDGMPLLNDVLLREDLLADRVESILLRPTSLATFYAGLHFVDALVARGNPTPSLVLPLVPGSRQDRVNPTGDYYFTIKSIAKDLNARDFPRVTVIDPHSDVTPALIERCQVYPPHLGDVPMPKYDAVVAPDGGAEKRAGAIATSKQIPLLHAWKKRDVTSGHLAGFGAEVRHGERTFGRLLLVDDLCDGGGTFVGLARELPEARLDLYVSHGLFTKGTAELLQYFEHIYCTDSTVGDKPGVTVIPRVHTLLNW